ncbi:MAG TPA: outer membrane protein assembly factor BamA, partial [Saprospiraceae bacterium]|nr:outer membrane protein assembly factor BamA [Saprospiraceae bacterium]
VSGASYSDENAIKLVSGLKVGAKIRVPGEDIGNAIRALWKLKLYDNVVITKDKTVGEVVFLNIKVVERPRIAKHSFLGVKKGTHEDLNKVVTRFLPEGTIVTENAKNNVEKGIANYFIEKGYLDTKVITKEEREDSTLNSVRLKFVIDRGKKVKIQDITFVGNKNVKASKLRKLMDKTKRRWKLFSSSKFIKKDYEEDKLSIIKYYNTIGFRDAIITKDTTWRGKNGYLRIQISIDEGNRYYFRNIKWKGNSIYDVATLQRVLGISKGDVYNQELLENRLRFSQDGRDVSSLYLDNGYLFFQVDPQEYVVTADSLDLEIKLYEGPQATIDRVIIKGNDRTHEDVIRRELRTRPGDKFSRSDIIRSQREISALGYFNPETLGVNPITNPDKKTVDIEYTVEEKPSDQLELSAGWGGAGRGIIGTLGVSFNNFSIRNIMHKEAWNPLPQGDGQRLSLRAQSNGTYYQSYNVSFTEPWLGGKKPTSLTVGGFLTSLGNGQDVGSTSYSNLKIINGTVGLGTRLKWPDDNFVLNTELNIQTLRLDNYPVQLSNGLSINNGNYHNWSLRFTLARNSIGDPIFPKDGSLIEFIGQFTPPYSLFSSKNYSTDPVEDRFKFLEYHKWRINAVWYTSLVQKLVLKASAKIGLLGYYNKQIGTSPFERFVLGGDGLSGQQAFYNGNDLISLRGYDVTDLPASNAGGGAAFDKFTLELRYPISLNPSSTIFMLTFLEGGNSWSSLRDFNPFDLKRSAGFGVRVFLPVFGTIGFDYGFGFDKVLPAGSGAGSYGRFSIILGFEPD